MGRLDGQNTLVDLLRARAEHEPDGVAFIFDDDGDVSGGPLTFAELDRQAAAAAAALRAGAAPGDRALLLLRPGFSYLSAFFGCLYAGVIAVPAYPPAGRDAGRVLSRLTAIAESAAPTVVLTHDEVVDTGRAFLADQLPVGARWLGMDSVERGGDRVVTATEPDTVAFLQYTSGSTAEPRGVVLTHRNLMTNLAFVAERFGTRRDSVGCSWLPPYHDMGLIGAILQPVFTGFPMVLMSPESFVRDPAAWLRAISQHRVTISGAPNFAYEMCVRRVSEKDKQSLDLSSWTVAFNGAEPVRADTLRRFADTFAECGFRAESWYPCYGLAEATLMVTGGRADRPATIRRFDPGALGHGRADLADDGRPLVACGQPAEDHTLVVVDPHTCRPCRSGEVGEIWLRGPAVATGYWDDPAASSATFGARLTDDPAGPAFLRTGDLGFRHDGDLFVSGRLKDLIIIRGRNHHPADIEAVIAASHPALRVPGVAFAVSRADGEDAVVAVHEARAGASSADLASAAVAARQAVAAGCGLHLAELVLVDPGAVPRTSSGKPRRSACRDSYLAGDLEPRYVSTATPDRDGAPASDARHDQQQPDEAAVVLRALALVDEPTARQALITTYLRARLATLLHLGPDEVAADTPMSALGLDSLLAIEFLASMKGDLGAEVTIDELLGDATPTSLAEMISAGTGTSDAAGDRSAPRSSPDEPAPLSYAQQRLWFLHQIDPDSAAYHVAAAFRVRGAVRADLLSRAMGMVVADQAALRTVIRTVDGEPRQVVLPEVDLPLERLAAPEGAELDLLGQWARQPFRLDRPPLARAAVVERSAEEHLIAFAAHHVICDAASMRVLITELGRYYAEFAAGRSPSAPARPVQHQDFARVQRTDPGRAAREKRDLEYWRERLRDVPPLGLGSDHSRPARRTGRGAGESFTLPAAVSAAITELARAQRATPFMVLLAAWQTVLLRLGAQPDIAVGVPVSNRETPGIAGLVGCFVDTLVLRTGLHGDPTFRELLDRVRDSAHAAYAHPAAPFDRLVDELKVTRHANRNPLFDASFSFFPELDVTDALPAAVIDVVEIETGYVQFDLVLEMMPDGAGLRGRIRYTSDLYDAATVRRMADRLARLVAQVTENPDRPLSAYSLLAEGEWDRLRDTQPRTDPFGPVLTALHEPFEAHSAAYPDDVALVDEHGEWRYAQVDARANQIAHLLRDHGVGPESTVGLVMATSAELVVAMLGILKSGGGYTPVEPNDPPGRIRDLLTDAGVRVVLADNDETVAALAGTPVRVIRTDREAELIDRQPSTRPDRPAAPHHLSYVIFTSGSTGRPKGVMVEHRHIVSFVRATADYLGSRRGDQYAMVSSIAADLGLTTLLPALRTGGRVHVVPRHVVVDPVLLAARFRNIRLDHLKIAPSHLSALLLAPGGAAILPSRTLVLGGEAVSWELVDRVREHAPDVTIVNEYGPTETAVANIIHRVRPDGTDRFTPLVPMSESLGGNRAYVLDTNLRAVPVGLVGELFLGGPQVARGYLNRPATTAERFLPDPYVDAPGARMYATGDRVRWLDESTMEFLGRIDNQVKVRGYRVEPGEIETVLRQHDQVHEAVVLAVADAAGEHSLVGYVPRESGSTVDERELREHLRAKLPRHMVPGELVILPTLPVLANGKVDRDALRAMPRPARPEPATRSQPATDAVQRALTRIWCEILDTNHIGVDDNFFDVGGHSLLLVTLQQRIAERLDRQVTVLDLMVNPTIEAQAAHLGTTGAGDGAAPPDDPAVERARARRDARRRRDLRGAQR